MGFLSNIVNGIKGVGNKITNGIGNITNTLNGYSEWLRGLSNELGSATGKNNATGGTSGANLGATAPGTTPTQTQTPSAAPSTAPSTAPTQTPSTAPSATPEATAPSATQGGTSEAPSPTTPGTEAVPDKEYTSQYSKEGKIDEEHIPTYEEFLMGNTAGYDHIRTETSAFYDEQAKKTLEALDEQRTAADNFAAGERDSVYGSLEAQKDEVYKYANEVLGDSLAYNKEAYDAIVKLLGEELEAGKLNAAEAKELLLSLAGETRQGVYDTAERQREEAHKNADIYRERANVNAQNAYAQNLAGYGANAEVLGRMGITGGGYGDWVNGNAYATKRAEVQAANAEAEGAKREAIYTEDMLKLQADNEYNKQKGQAEFDYLERLYNLDSNYRTGMAEAEQTKAKADKAAEDTARDTKFKADTLEREGKAEADRIYRGSLYENQAAYDKGALEANQAAAAGKFQAEMDYVQNVMKNDERIAEYMEKLKAGDEEAQRQQKEIFAQLLSGAANGTYGADEVKILANMFGFDETQVGQLTDTAGKYDTEQADARKSQGVIDLLGKAKSGQLNSDEITALAGQYGLDASDPKDAALLKMITGAADESAGITAADNFASILGMVNSGQLTGDEASKMAVALGIDGQYGTLITQAAKRHAEGTAESEAKAKTDNFIALLGMANSGELNEGELLEVAKQLGFDISEGSDDSTSIDLIKNAAQRYSDGTAEGKAAAKNANFISLLDAANTGAYTAEQIPELANMLGLDANNEDDERLINMLTTAATSYADGKSAAETAANTEYMNGVYAELMTAAASGSLDAEAIKAIAGRVGFGETEISELAGAATRKSDKEKKETQDQNILNMMAESGDAVGYIQTAIEKGALNKDDASRYLMSSFKTAIETDESFDSAAVKDALDKGYISQPEFDELKKQYSATIDVSVNNFPESGDFTENFTAGARLVQSIFRDPLVTSEVKEAVAASFGKRFGNSKAFMTDEQKEVFYWCSDYIH